MKYRWILSVLLFGVCALAYAKTQIVSLGDLNPEKQHRRSAVWIAQALENYHYIKPDINDRLAKLAFARYLKALDANRNFLLRDDIEHFKRYRDQFDDSFVSGHLDPAYRLFKTFRQRVRERVDHAKDLLDSHRFDFTLNERYTFDRSEADWAESHAILDEIWRKRVKNDLLAEYLSKDADESFDFIEIKETLHKRYDNLARRVMQMNAEDVFQLFVNAFTLSIEPHTSYMAPRISENFDIGMRLSLQGIGAVLRTDDEYTQILRVVPGGPAAKSGEIRPGDRIVGVGQGRRGAMEDVVGWRLQDVVDLIRGEKDSIVRLNITPKREGPGGRSHEVVLTRDQIKLEDKAANHHILQDDAFGGLRIGVIEIPTFYRDFAGEASGKANFRSTTRDVRKLLIEMRKSGVEGVIIDLRNNGGGSLSEATELTGLFIKQGPIVQVKRSSGDVEIERDADPEQIYRGPLAVLVNRNSASASEIFAGAIQDYRRGLVIGEPTFGKGTVQTLVNLGDYLKTGKKLGRLRLTMAQFFRVQGASTQHKGVVPDIVFPTAKGADEHGERALDHALPWASIRPAAHTAQANLPLALVREQSRQRVAKDPGFNYLLAQENELMRIDAIKDISLHEAERRTEREQRERRQLAYRNQLRLYRGLPALKTLERQDELELAAQADDDPEEIQRIMLDESARVLVDYIHAHQPMTAQAD